MVCKWTPNELLVCITEKAIDQFQIATERDEIHNLNRFLLQFPECNPKLSEATPTTRIAYVKFMAPTIRRESLADDETKKPEPDRNKLRKSILRAASKTSMVDNENNGKNIYIST